MLACPVGERRPDQVPDPVVGEGRGAAGLVGRRDPPALEVVGVGLGRSIGIGLADGAVQIVIVEAREPPEGIPPAGEQSGRRVRRLRATPFWVAIGHEAIASVVAEVSGQGLG